MQDVIDWIVALLCVAGILAVLMFGGILLVGFIGIMAALFVSACVIDVVIAMLRGLSSLFSRSGAKGERERRKDG